MTRKIYLLTISALIVLGGLMIISSGIQNHKFRSDGELKRKLSGLFAGLSKGGIDRYSAVLIIVTGLFIIESLFKLTSDFEGGLTGIILSLLMYELLRPVEQMWGRKSLYRWLKDKSDKLKKQNYREELFEITVQLKNLLISTGGNSTSQYVIQQLLPYTNYTKEYFAQLLSMNMKDEVEKAANMFTEKFGMKLAGDFVYIVKRLDYMKKDDFMPMLDTLLDNFREEQQTIQVKSQTRKENILFLLASAEIVALIGNFVILIFINTISQINAL